MNEMLRESQAAAVFDDELRIKLGSSMAEVERQLILATLRHYNNHKERAAAALGVSLKTLYNRLRDYSAKPAANCNAVRERRLAR